MRSEAAYKKRLEYIKQWKKRNPEKVRAYKRTERERLMADPKQHARLKLRWKLYARKWRAENYERWLVSNREHQRTYLARQKAKAGK